MWVEDLTNSPGTATNLFTTTASRAESVTAQGREYIALSDGIHGYDVPLSYDGSLLQRVTQDGPGTPPTVASIAYASEPLINGGSVVLTISSIASSGIHLRPFPNPPIYTTFTVTLTAPATLIAGTTIVIAGNSESSFNGTWTINDIINPNTFTVVLAQTTPVSGTGGTATTPAFSLQRAGNTVTASMGSPGLFQVGYQALIAGVPANQVGGGIVSIVIDNENLPGIATITTTTAHGLLPGNNVNIDGVNAVAVGGGLATTTTAAQIATSVTNSPHGLSWWDRRSSFNTVGGAPQSGNFPTTVISVPTPTSFCFVHNDIDATIWLGERAVLIWPPGGRNQ